MSRDILPRPHNGSSPYRKINEQGKYCPFPGVTVVSSVGPSNSDLWLHIFQALNGLSKITDHYALLPVDSYHMTTINLFVAETNPEAWNDHINKNLSWFQNLAASINKETDFNPEVLSIYPEFHGGIILLRVILPEEQKRKNFELAQKYGIVNLIPNIQFHITLGYIYKAIPSQEIEIITRLFEDSIQNILRNYSKPIRFEKPELTYFHDMAAFIPWKGERNPFTESV